MKPLNFLLGCLLIAFSSHSIAEVSLNSAFKQNQANLVKNLYPNSKLPEYFGDNLALAQHYYQNYNSQPYRDIPLATNPFDGFLSAKIFLVPLKGDAVLNIADTIKRAKEFVDNKQSKTQAIIQFQAGNYELNDCLNEGKNSYANKKLNSCFYLNKHKNILFSGVRYATKIINKTPQSTIFSLEKTRNLYFQNLSFDYAVLPSIQGIIKNIRAKKKQVMFDLQLTHNETYENIQTFNSFSGSKGGRGMGIVYDSVRPYRKPNTYSFYYMDNIKEKKPSQTWEFKLSKRHAKRFTETVQENDQFVFTARRNFNIFKVRGSINFGLNHINVHSAYGVAVVMVGNEGEIVINDLQIKRPLFSNRIVVGNAGGIHAQQNRAKITVQNSYFEGLGDDAINIYNHGGFVTAKQDKTYIVHEQWNVRAGDRLQFVDPTNLSVLGTTTVLNAKPVKGRALQITTDQAIAGVNIGNGSMPAEAVRKKGKYLNTVVFNLSASSSNSEVKNNIFGPSRRAGVLMRSPNGKITNNVFMKVDINAIRIFAALNRFTEGPCPDNILLQNNKTDGENKHPHVYFVNCKGQ